MADETTKPPGAGSGGEGGAKGDTFTSADGWNYLTRVLHTRSPRGLQQARRATKSIDHLIRTGR
jgi:hypothetical protein